MMDNVITVNEGEVLFHFTNFLLKRVHLINFIAMHIMKIKYVLLNKIKVVKFYLVTHTTFNSEVVPLTIPVLQQQIHE